MSFARWKPVIAPHSPSNAVRAAPTARSTSASSASGTRAHGSPVYGSTVS